MEYYAALKSNKVNICKSIWIYLLKHKPLYKNWEWYDL